jgi:hypothetical protein
MQSLTLRMASFGSPWLPIHIKFSLDNSLLLNIITIVAISMVDDMLYHQEEQQCTLP